MPYISVLYLEAIGQSKLREAVWKSGKDEVSADGTTVVFPFRAAEMAHQGALPHDWASLHKGRP